jgi:hypothetical protein
MVGFGFAVFFAGAGVAIGVSGRLPSALAPAAFLLAVLNAISGVALFARSGFFAIGGAYGYIVPLVSLIWILVVSVLMLRPERQSSGPAPSRLVRLLEPRRGFASGTDPGQHECAPMRRASISTLLQVVTDVSGEPGHRDLRLLRSRGRWAMPYLLAASLSS